MMLTIISFLSNPVLWYVLLGAVGVIVVTILCLKFEVARWIAGTVMVLLLIGTSIYSSIQLNTYYSAEGGIYGYLGGLLKKNQVEVVSGMNFKLTEIRLAGTANYDEYSAEFDIDKVYSLDQKTDYGLLINGFPVSNVSISATSISGDLNYNFYSEEDNVIINDILAVRIAFGTKKTHISLQTHGGGQALKYWNLFFGKNEFLIEVTTDGYVNS